jgi:hypothetical protein
MTSLWRALAVVWLGGVASPALMDPAPPLPDLTVETAARARPRAAATAADEFEAQLADAGVLISPARHRKRG